MHCNIAKPHHLLELLGHQRKNIARALRHTEFFTFMVILASRPRGICVRSYELNSNF
jgi:hypothetical protein